MTAVSQAYDPIRAQMVIKEANKLRSDYICQKLITQAHRDEVLVEVKKIFGSDHPFDKSSVPIGCTYYDRYYAGLMPDMPCVIAKNPFSTYIFFVNEKTYTLEEACITYGRDITIIFKFDESLNIIDEIFKDYY